MRMCPQCKSMDVSADLSALAFGKGAVFNSYHCNECGFEGELFPDLEDTE